jgi:hypothetical protein
MKILTAKFVNGRLDLPEGSVREGDTVTLLVPEQEEEFSLTPEGEISPRRRHCPGE